MKPMTNGDDAVFPSGASNMAVNISDWTPGLGLVWADSIEFQSGGVQVQGNSASDVLAINPAIPLSLTRFNSGT